MDVGLPQKNNESLKNHLFTAFQHSSGLKFEEPPGPVHLNFPFDEPLLSENVCDINSPSFTFENNKKYDKIFSIPILTNSIQPLIIVGPMEGNHHQKELIQLAEKIKAPILADALSQLRFGSASKIVLANYDYFLRYKEIIPDLIIRFGRKPTSKVLNQLLDNWKDRTILIDAWRQFNDDCPQFIQSTIEAYCQYQIENCDWKGGEEWQNQLLAWEKQVSKFLLQESVYSEGTIAKCCVESIDDGGELFIGNSMPIRDVDMFTLTSLKKIDTYSNRGASGIDGVISSALGMSHNSENKNALLLIGDVSFYHDMNGLLASRYEVNLTIVVINNGGGGIFSFLPIAESGVESFSQYWTTDTGLSIEKVAELYNSKYYLADNLQGLEKSIIDSFTIKGVKIIEVKTTIQENIKAHNRLSDIIKVALSDD
jgi:2-succinyl-5-enolpyruvyl-6-hydroxy-3-cyclohexene-1-carboxylate synthase